MESLYQTDPPTADPPMEIITAGRSETFKVGALLGRMLEAGDTVCLDGDLGAGKTVFTAGIARGMGICGVIASPTFTILIEHTKHGPDTENGIPLYHFDAYRLEDAEDFYHLGFDEYFSAGGVCVIEWADRIRAAILPDAIRITLRQASDDVSDRRWILVAFPPEDPRAVLFSSKINGGEWRTS